MVHTAIMVLKATQNLPRRLPPLNDLIKVQNYPFCLNYITSNISLQCQVEKVA